MAPGSCRAHVHHSFYPIVRLRRVGARVPIALTAIILGIVMNSRWDWLGILRDHWRRAHRAALFPRAISLADVFRRTSSEKELGDIKGNLILMIRQKRSGR